MSELDEIWKADAIERMAEDDAVIFEQRERIEVLEFNLSKLRDLILDGYMKTAHLVPPPWSQPETAKPKRRKAKNEST